MYNKKVPTRVKIRNEAIYEMFDMKNAKLSALEESLAAEREEYYNKKDEVSQHVINSPKATLNNNLELGAVDTFTPVYSL